MLGGGYYNYVGSLANYSVLAGGQANSLTNMAHGSVLGGGYYNTVSGRWSVVAGGYRNLMGGEYAVIAGGTSNVVYGDYAVVPGGKQNAAAAPYSFAAGYKASAAHTGAFVWADSSGGTFSSTTNDQVAIRATNGVWMAANLGATRTAQFGERFRDNGIIAWARIDTAGGIAQDFNVTQCVNTATGAYRLDIGDTASDMERLIPVAVAEVDSQPTTAAGLRIISVNQNAQNRFDVWINDGTGAAVNNDFLFIVTGR